MALTRKLILFLLLACTLGVERANAHFVFVYGEDGKVKIVFGESTDPDQAQFLGGLSSMKAFTFVDGEKKEVEFKKVVEGDDGWFEASQNGVGSVVNITCPYGVFGRGDKSMYLDYSAKFVRFPIDTASAKPSTELKLDMVPSFENGQLKVAVHFNGMPLNDAEVKLELVEYESFEAKTDDTGAALLSAHTRYIVRAKHVEVEAGELDGKKFSEKRYYCTMVLDLGDKSADAEVAVVDTPESKIKSSVTLQPVDRGYEDFPKGMTSFGATVLDNRIYVTGGKSGRAHHYARSYQNNEIWCLDLAGKKWETAGETLGLQGLAIVAHDGKMIRIGGLEVRNEEGEEQALRSIAAVKAFDPATKQWTTLPSLPQGRSSFDACLHDNKIFVVGGWTMVIGEEPEWAEDMLVLDLSSEAPQWQSVETPFMTRALAVRVHDNKLFAIGGIEDGGRPTEVVHVFDLENEEWTDGPEIPCEGGMKAFGCSAVSVAGHLLVGTYDGGVYRLDDDHSGWEKVHQLETGRFFHQMMPAGESSFAIIGGSHMKHGSQMGIAVFSVANDGEPKVSVRRGH